MSALPPRPVYLDNNATTAVAPEVFEAMVPFLTEHYGNPSSAYDIARHSRDAVAKAREQIAALIHCDPREIVFTSCGSESDNTAVWSGLRTTGKRHIVTTQVEHSAIHHLCEGLEHQGYSVTWLPVRGDGTLDPATVEEAIHDDTALVTAMWANNETGIVFPVAEIAEICRRKNILFHTDAVQVPGKLPIDLRAVKADFLALSGHKLHAPKGIGVLYVRNGTKFAPWLVGGSQERERRAGTENVPYIVGLGRAAELAAEHLIDEQTTTRARRDRLESEILRLVPGAHRNGHPAERLPNTSSLWFDGVEAEAVLLKLNAQGICASSGSACTTGSLAPSHVLTAMGLTADQARSSLRLSLSRFTTDAEIDHALAVLPAAIAELRAALPQAAR